MPDTIECAIHGTSPKAYVCQHLVGEKFGLGFHGEEPDSESPYPDAWCDDCEAYRLAYSGWNEETAKRAGISLVCTACYERAKMCNTKSRDTLSELANLRWKCGNCDEWHYVPMLDVGSDRPRYWSDNSARGQRWAFDGHGTRVAGTPTFLDSDYCAIEDEHFFVRGILHIPIRGAGEAFRFGVWGSLSRANFEALLKADAANDKRRFEAMFSWLSTWMNPYPDTDQIKMRGHVQEQGTRPHFLLEPTEHPLARDHCEGISIARLKEIMFTYLPGRQI